ncbi:MAG: sensor histidine kinase [Blastocatellia bacterium]
MKCRRVTLLAGTVLALAWTVLAQYHFDSWTTNNGLPHNWIQAVRQTRDGYLWLTTRDGLARFDGLRFRVFNKNNTPEMTSNRFTYHALWEDREGNLWMGTLDGGVIRHRDGVFTAYTTRDGLPDNAINRIDEDASGTVWFFTKGGLAQWKDGRLTRVTAGPDGSFDAYLTTPGNFGIDGIYFGLWRLGAIGWERFAYGQWTPLPLPARITDPAKLRIDSTFEDAERRFWYDLADREDEYYCVVDGRLSVYPAIPNTRDIQHACYQDRKGRLWVGSQKGIVRLWKDRQATPLDGFATPYIFKVLEDREGTLWIASLSEGLYRFREQPITVYRFPGGPQFNFIHQVWQDRSGRYWIGSGGFAEFKDGQFKTFHRAGRSRAPWSWGNIIGALYEDLDGALWLATWDGIVRFKDGQIIEEKSLSAQIKGHVNSVRRDRAGDLWFGSVQGLYRVHQDKGEDKVTRYTTREGLASDSINVVFEDRAGTLLIGTTGGLSRFTGERFLPVEGLASSHITTLYEDQSGVLWIGTYDGGLRRLADGKLTSYTTEQGLYNNRIFQILEDDLGFLWMSNHLGLYRVRKQELERFAAGQISSINSTHFGQADGLVNVECAADGQPAGFKARDGKLWFPTMGGVAVVDPRAVPFNPTPPPVVIEECLLDRQPAAMQSGLLINPRQENLEINYTALSLIKSEQIRFKYKLEGLNTDWIEAGERRTAYYSHIPPGQYVFKVTAANSDGVWNPVGQSLRIVVLPPFYRTWWFLTLVGLAAAGLVVAAWKLRLAQFKRAQAVQQAFSRQLIASQENERKRIAAELHDSLGQRLVVIKNLALMFLQSPANNGQGSGQGRQQIENLSAETSQAIGEVKEISYNLRPYQLDRIGLTKAVEAIVRTAAAASQITFTTAIENIDDVFPKESEINFYRIVQESVNNILKHSQATAASVTIQCDGGRLRLMIRDNGQGFAPGTSSADPKKGGFGLLGIGERARLLGGEPVIHSVPGQGTTIIVEIDLAKVVA